MVIVSIHLDLNRTWLERIVSCSLVVLIPNEWRAEEAPRKERGASLGHLAVAV